MKKIIFVILLWSVFLILLPQTTLAADYSISCFGSSCSSTLPSFFPASDIWYPGLIKSKSVQVNNDIGSPLAISINSSNDTTDGNMDEVIQLTVTKSDNSQVYSDSLHNFYNSGITQILSSLASGSSEVFTFTCEMYYDADNKYQNKSTKFDLHINMYNPDWQPSPTPCPENILKPGVPSSPTLSQNSSSEVKVTWSSVSDPVTGYYISWGTETNAEGTGSKSVGKTTETTIGNLNLGDKCYYFKVRSTNDCRDGEYGGIGSIGNCLTIGGFTSTGLTQGIFTANYVGGETLGEATESAPIATTTPTTKTQNVKGVSTKLSLCDKCLWLQILLGELVALLLYYFWYAKRNPDKKRLGLWGLLIPIITYLVFIFLNQGCLGGFKFVLIFPSSNFFCRYFVLIEILLYAIVAIIWKKYFRTKNV